MFNVVLFNGELCYDEMDFALAGLIPIELSRTYRSTLRRAGRLGFGWTWPWEMALRRTQDGFAFEVDSGAMTEHYPVPTSPSGAGGAPLRRQGPLLALTRDNGYVYYFVAEDTLRSRGALIGAIEDVNGNRLIFDHFADRVRILRDGEGRALHFSYDASGRLVTVDLVGGVPDAPSRVATYHYSIAGDLIHVDNRSGARTSYEYEDHLLVTLRTATGGAYHAQYDAARRCISRWREDGRLTTLFAYDDRLRQVLVTDALGYAELVVLGERGEIQEEVLPTGSVKTYSHDANGGLLSVSRAGADTLVISETSAGQQRVTMADEAGVTLTQTVYLNTGTVEVHDACGGVWATVHDAKQQVIEERLPSGAITRYEYEQNGLLRTIIEPTGNRVRVTYGDRGRLAVVHDDLGEVARQRWDAEGRLVEYAEPGTTPVRYRYDGLGRVTGVTQPSGAVFEFRLDPLGECVEVVDPSGAITRYGYSPYGELLSETTPEGGEIHWVYDALARVTAIRNQANEEMRFEYDALGRMVRQTFFDGRAEQYRYDDADYLVAIDQADGEPAVLERDPAGRILRVTSAGDSLETVTYDEAGRAVELANGDVVVRFEYEPGHLITREEQDGVRLEREYNIVGDCIGLTVTGLGRRTFEYDGRRRLTTVEDFDGTTIAFTYDLQDRLIGMTADGIDVRYDYASFGRLVTTQAFVDTEVFRLSYEYDPLGRVVRRRTSGRDDLTFEYDRDARLIAHRRGGLRTQHRHNATGDLIQSGHDAPHRYGPGSRLEASGATTFAHDARGRIVERIGPGGRILFAYDGFDRLARVTSSLSGSAQFSYDADGRLLRKLTETGETRYVWDQDMVIAEISEEGHITSFVTSSATLGSLWISGSALRGALMNDVNAYPLSCIRPDGRRLDDDPDPWGGSRLSSDPAATQPLRLAGQYALPDIGLHYNRHRFYDPTTAHYLTPDPIGINGGLNAYSYPSDPVNVVDPLGLTITVLNPGQKPQVRKKECPPKPGEPKARPGPDPESSACPASRGASIHNDCIKLMQSKVKGQRETRTDAPMKFGKNKMNRPDLTMFKAGLEETTSTFCEWDYSPARRARQHIRDICRNHPGSTIYLVKLPQSSRFNSGRPGKPTPQKLGKISRPTAGGGGGPSEKDCGINVIADDMGI